jgi:hypothetical protein
LIDLGFFLGLVGAVLCACAAYRHSPGLVLAAALVSMSWLLNWWSFGCQPLGCAPMSHLTMMDSETIWMYSDAICGGLIGGIVGRGKPWGFALWALYLFQCLFHIGWKAQWVDYPFYGNVLDAALLGQYAVFYLVGGRYVGDYCRSGVSALRRVVRPSRVLQGKDA